MKKNKAGQPTKLTKEKQEEICSYIKGGNTFRRACVLSNIGESTFMLWRQKGKEQQEEINKNGVKKGEDYRYLEFLEATKKAEEQFVAFHVLNIHEESKKNWCASAWLLERRRPEEFGKRYEIRGEMNIANYDIELTEEENRAYKERLKNMYPGMVEKENN